MSVDIFKVDGKVYSIKITDGDVSRLRSIIDHMYFALAQQQYIYPQEQLANLPTIINILERPI
jgi:hypothetical protein